MIEADIRAELAAATKDKSRRQLALQAARRFILQRFEATIIAERLRVKDRVVDFEHGTITYAPEYFRGPHAVPDLYLSVRGELEKLMSETARSLENAERTERIRAWVAEQSAG